MTKHYRYTFTADCPVYGLYFTTVISCNIKGAEKTLMARDHVSLDNIQFVSKRNCLL